MTTKERIEKDIKDHVDDLIEASQGFCVRVVETEIMSKTHLIVSNLRNLSVEGTPAGVQERILARRIIWDRVMKETIKELKEIYKKNNHKL